MDISKFREIVENVRSPIFICSLILAVISTPEPIGPSGCCLSRFSALIGEKKRHYQHEDTNPAQIEIRTLSAWGHKKGTISISTQNFISFSDVGK